MAIYNEILSGRYNRALQKLLSIKGGPPAPQLASDVSPSLVFFNGVENRYLESWNRYGAAVANTANAANQSAIRIRNPATSKVVAVFEKILTANSNAAALNEGVQIGATAGDLATLSTATARRLDARSNPNPSVIVSQTNIAPGNVATSILFYLLTVNQSLDLIFFEDQELTLLPGDAIQLITSTTNVAQNCNFIWRERNLEDSELF